MINLNLTPPSGFLPGSLSATPGNGPIAGYTAEYKLNLVNFDWVTWHDYEWQNWTVVDTLLHAALGALEIDGVWKPNTVYALNTIVVDARGGGMLICTSAHTSSENLDADITAGKWADYDVSGAPVTVSATAPLSPVPGDLWYATAEPVGLFVWYNDGNSSQWVQTNGGEGTPDLPLTGGTLTGPLNIQSGALVLTSSPVSLTSSPLTLNSSAVVLNSSNVTINSTTPSITFHETDAVLPVGLVRIQHSTNALRFNFNTAPAGDFSTAQSAMRMFTGGILVDVPFDAGTFKVAGALEHNINVGYMYQGSYSSTYGAGYARSYTDYTGRRTVVHGVDVNKANPVAWGLASSNWFIDDGGVATFGTTRLNATPDATPSSGAISAGVGDVLTFYSGLTVGGIHQFRDNLGAALAYVYPIGTAAANALTIMTREKGDLRYGIVSSERYKDGIHAADERALISAFNGLTVREWEWGGELPDSDERVGRKGVGIIAEEVVELLPSAATYKWDSATSLRVDGADPLALIAVLIAKIREQGDRIAALEAR